MNEFVKNLGVIILLIGVVFLVIYSVLSQPSNVWLIAGLVSMIIGICAHILINKRDK